MYVCVCVYIYICTVHVFVPNSHGTDLSVRCMRPYNEYRQFTPNPEGGARRNATLFDNRQQKNSECCELRTLKQSSLCCDHVLILNIESLTLTKKKYTLNQVCSSNLSLEGQSAAEFSSNPD